jgi:hypothetical protein
MSFDLIVNLRHSSLPSQAGWQQAIREAGFPVEFKADFDADAFCGFLPCELEGKEAGFEYMPTWMTPAEAEEVDAPAGTDFSVTLNSHTHLRDFVCAALAAAALAKASDGELVDPQIGKSFAPADAIDWAIQQLRGLNAGWFTRLIKRSFE